MKNILFPKSRNFWIFSFGPWGPGPGGPVGHGHDRAGARAALISYIQMQCIMLRSIIRDALVDASSIAASNNNDDAL